VYRDGLKKLFSKANFKRDTPLALACASREGNCVQLWIMRYVYMNFSSYLKTTEDESKCQVLKRYLEKTNKNGMTPLSLAKSTGWYLFFKDLTNSYYIKCNCATPLGCHHSSESFLNHRLYSLFVVCLLQIVYIC
jgi:hypothetical protein